MELLDLLPPEHVLVPLLATDLRDGIERLLDALEGSGAVQRSDALHDRVRNEPLREVVAISEDVVLPHYRSEAVSDVVLGLGVAPDRLAASEPGLDVRPRLVALVLAPVNAPTLYLQTTSTLARLLRRPGIVDVLARQPDAAAVLGLPELQALRIQPSLTVRDIMMHRIHTLPPDATVRSALDLMLRRRLRSVPVVGEKGEVLGVVTEADLLTALLPHVPRAGREDAQAAPPGPGPGDRPVRDIMDRSVLCVPEDMGVREIASVMINKHVDQIPVVQAGAITGVVARADIIRKLFGRS